VLNREDRSTLERWLRLLPEDFVKRRPWLLTIQAFTLQFSWQLPAVWKLIGPIEALIDESDEAAANADDLVDLPVLRGLIAILRGQEAFTAKCDAASAIAYCKEAWSLLPERWHYGRGATLIYWGMGMRAGGEAGTAQRILLDEYASLQGRTNAYALRILFAVCLNSLETGDLEQVKQLAQVMLEQATRGQLAMLEGWAHYFLGMVHYCWNELDAAAHHFAELVEKRYVVHAQTARCGMIGLAQIHLVKAEFPEVWLTLELLGQLDRDRLGQEGDDLCSLRAQVAYLQGDSAKALHWADAYTTSVPDRLLTWLQDPHVAKAHILLASGTDTDVQAALALLDALLAIAQRTFSIRWQIELLALRAVALERQGKFAAASTALQQAVELARPGGFIRVFVGLGPPMQTMLRRLGENGFSPEVLCPILAAFPEAQSKIRTSNGRFERLMAEAELVEPLTDRELDVLALLRERLMDKEIAHSLGLATATVKRHTANIYGKLGVSARRDAVNQAEALGILPPR
jgi:LuxR family maltose regulon positive regulatory protein